MEKDVTTDAFGHHSREGSKARWTSMTIGIYSRPAVRTHSRRLSIGWISRHHLLIQGIGIRVKEVLESDSGSFGDLPENPSRLTLAVQNKRNPGFSDSQVAGQLPLSESLLRHDALNFFCHSLLT